MKTISRFALVLVLWTAVLRADAQTPAQLAIQRYAGLTITGTVGTVYEIQFITDLSQTNDASAWRCLEFLELQVTPYLWADKSSPMTGRRFYRTLQFGAPSNMVFIPPGTFRMGSPTNEIGRLDDEGPQTAVTISRGFWMGKHEVTQGEYLALMGNNPSFFSLKNGYAEDLNRPVDQVTWYDATTYCEALTQRELAAGRITANHLYRLPTEAEWEYACRAWTSTAFSYGDDPGYLTNFGWYDGNSDSMTHPVGQKLPNAWGLYDMLGNAGEWCQDWYGPYPGGIALDPQGPAAGSERVGRSGAWLYGAGFARSAFRLHRDPTAGSTRSSLRVVPHPG